MAEIGGKLTRSKERLQTKQSTVQPSSQVKNETVDSSMNNLVWKDLNEDQVVLFMSLTPQDLEIKLAEFLSLQSCHINLEEACLVDYYVSALWFAKQVQFTTEQTAAFFSLMKVLLENIKDKRKSLSDNICFVKKYLIQKLLPSSLYSTRETKLISNYIIESLLQHYKLYQFLFSSQQSTEYHDDCIIKENLLVEAPPLASLPFPPPLEEGLPEEIHSKHVLGIEQMNTFNETDMNGTLEVCEGNKSAEKEETVVSNEQSQQALLTSIPPDEMKKVLKDVSESILNDMKVGVQKKLKERESTLLTKISKK